MASVCYLVLAGVLVGFGVRQVGKTPERLSEAEIAELREEYPILPLSFSCLMSYHIPSLDEVTEDMECFTYAEIVKDSDTYSNYRYTLRVIRDTEGFYRPGEEILIGPDYRKNNGKPHFRAGMKIVYGTYLSKYREGNPKDTEYTVIGTYYVTDDGYVLSAFPEIPEIMKDREPYTGVKVEYLLKKLRKPRWR